MTHYIFGSGMVGCLFDSGPYYCETVDQAVALAVDLFEDSLTGEELETMRRYLREGGCYYFSEPSEAGAQVVSVTSCDCNEQTSHMDPDEAAEWLANRDTQPGDEP